MVDPIIEFGQGGKETSSRPLALWMILGLIVAVSLAVRVAAWAHWGTGAIENEGAEYARIAENIRNGVGFVGMAMPGTQVNFNPLFPLLIAGASYITRDYEWAARLVSLLLGCLLPLPVFGVASRLFNRRVGFIAAVLTILHPLSINLSFTAFSEAAYMTLLLSAVYVALRALDHSSIALWLLVGGTFGLAYLLRGEAVAVFLIAILFALAATSGGPALRGKRAAAAITVFVLLALPEVLLMYRSTGRILLEGKSTIFYFIDSRILAAETSLAVDHQLPDGQDGELSSASDPALNWAHWAIDGQLRGTGVMQSGAQIIRETRVTVRGLAGLLRKGARRNISELLRTLSSSWFGAPFLPALALLGAVRRPWRRPQALSRLFIIFIPAAPIAATFSRFWSDPRHYCILVPFLSIWAASGLDEVGRWTKASCAAAGWRLPAGDPICRFAVPALIGLASVIWPVKGVRTLYFSAEGSRSSLVEKRVGSWIGHQQARSVRVMDLYLRPAYHADAQFTHFPYCTGELALRYLDAAHVDYLVLRRGQTFTRYYEDWLTHGIPDPRAELLHLFPDTDAQFVIYRWHRGG